jgi:hypothetical protein
MQGEHRMLNMFRDGGLPMWFLLAFGLATLFFAARFAWAPVRRTLRITLALGAATGFTSLTGICTDFATVGRHAPRFPKGKLVELLLQGMAESLSPGILGFTFLSLAALIVALGFHREVAE